MWHLSLADRQLVAWETAPVASLPACLDGRCYFARSGWADVGEPGQDSDEQEYARELVSAGPTGRDQRAIWNNTGSFHRGALPAHMATHRGTVYVAMQSPDGRASALCRVITDGQSERLEDVCTLPNGYIEGTSFSDSACYVTVSPLAQRYGVVFRQIAPGPDADHPPILYRVPLPAGPSR